MDNSCNTVNTRFKIHPQTGWLNLARIMILVVAVGSAERVDAEISLVGSYDVQGARGVFIRGSVAYVAGSQGLQILDVSDPADIVLRGSYDDIVDIYRIFVDGTVAYGASYGYHGYTDPGYKFDISNPADVTVIAPFSFPEFRVDIPGSSYRILENTHDFFVDGSVAYRVGSGYHRGGLQILDISDSANITVLDTYLTEPAFDMFIEKSLVYVFGWNGVEILDVSDFTNIRLAGSFEGRYHAGFVQDDVAYVSGWNSLNSSNGIHILDISDPVNVKALGSYTVSDSLAEIYVSESLAWVAVGWGQGLRVLDISDPTNTKLLDSYEVGDYNSTFFFDGKRAYVIEQNMLQVLEYFPTHQIITFADPNFEAAVRQAISKPDGDILPADVEGVTELDASGRDVVSLEGIENLTNLQTLFLQNNQLTEISLAGLTNLTYLYLSNNQLTEISVPAELTNLQGLNLEGNQLTEISLSGLTNLRWLDLRDNQLTEISLAGLTSLYQLNSSNNQLKSVTLSDLSNLVNLHLSNNQLSDISLSGVAKLDTLDLSHNQLSDISFLSELVDPIYLYLSNNQISNISPLVENKGIASRDNIDLRGNPLNVDAYSTHIPALQERGVSVQFDESESYVEKWQYRLLPGWHMVSVPFQVLDSTLSSTFPTANSLQQFDHIYMSATSFERGRGYWIHIPPDSAAYPYLSGVPFASSVLDLPAGWSMVGLTTNRDTLNVEALKETRRILSVFEFDGGYRPAVKMIPGKGYWVRVDTAGLYEFGNVGWLEPTQEPPFSGVKLWASSRDSRREIHLGVPRNQIEELPPIPLGNTFDVRVEINDIGTWQVPLTSKSTDYRLRLQGEEVLLGWTVPPEEIGKWQLVINSQVGDLVGSDSIAVNVTEDVILVRQTTLESTPISFADPNLEAAVREAIPKLSGDILPADVEELTELDLTGITVVSLKGIENLTNLQILLLNNNRQLDDISSLSELTNLQTLKLRYNQLTEIPSLSDLTNLQTLDLTNNQLTEIPSLSNLTNLQTLNLNNNRLTDVSSLAGLTSLQKLQLYNNQLSSISPLANLTSLTFLQISYNRLTDISSLSDLTNLQTLQVHRNQLSNISSLSDLVSLTDLNLSNNQIRDISALADNSKLDSGVLIDLRSNPLNSEAYSTNIPALQARGATVYFDQPEPTPISFADPNLEAAVRQAISKPSGDILPADVEELRYLFASGRDIVRCDGIENLTNLQTLDLHDNQITEISQLSDLSNLRTLDLRNNQLSSIPALSEVTNLDSLSLFNNRISDISTLVENDGIGSGVKINLQLNPLSAEAYTTHIPALQARGVIVEFDEPADFPTDNLPDLILHIAPEDSIDGFGSVKKRTKSIISYVGPGKAFGYFNNDSYEDLVVLASHFHNSNGEKVGRIFLYYGTASGIDTTTYIKIDGIYGISEDRNGLYRATVGDFNNDGYDDLVVGSDWYQKQGETTARGYAFAILSNKDGTGLDLANYIEFIGYTPYGTLAYSMDTGDINGDGIDDLIMNSLLDGNFEGRIYVFYGDDEFDNIHDKILKAARRQRLELQGVGDINGDGFDDIIGRDITGWNHVNGQLQIWLGGEDMSELPAYSRPISYGWVHQVGDLNGDNYADIVVLNSSKLNEVYAPDISSNIMIIKGGSNFDIYDNTEIALEGHHAYISAIRDINSDGLNDLFIDIHDESDNARSYIFSGDNRNYVDVSDTLLQFIDFDDSYGSSIEHIIPADINGDGKWEFYGYSEMSPYKGVIFMYNAPENLPSQPAIFFVDSTLNAIVRDVIFKSNEDILPVDVERIKHLGAGGVGIANIAGIENLTHLEDLYLPDNKLTNLSPLSKLHRLRNLDLSNNEIADIAPLVNNHGVGSGDQINLRGNPLNSKAYLTHIPALKARGVVVEFDQLKETNRDFTIPIHLPAIVPVPEVGQNAQMAVEVDNIIQATGFSITAKFDRDLFAFDAVANGTLIRSISSPLLSVDADGMGVVVVSGDRYGGSSASGSGSLATLFFTTVGEMPPEGAFVSIVEIEIRASDNDVSRRTFDLDEFGIAFTGNAESPISMDFDLAQGDQEKRTAQGAASGKTYQVQLNVDSAPEIKGWSTTLEYDPSQVRYVEGSFHPSDFIGNLTPLVESKEGRVSVGGTLLGFDHTSSGDGSLGTLSFEILDGFSESTDLIITEIKFHRPDRIQTQRVKTTATITSEVPAILGDSDGNGVVNFADFFLFADAFGGTDPNFDFNGDGSVDFNDFFIFADYFGKDARGKLMALAHEYLGLPSSARLEHSYPNPFNSSTTIRYWIPESETVHVDIFDLTGQRIKSLVGSFQATGSYEIAWDGTNERGMGVSSGMYLVKFQAGKYIEVRKAMLMK